MVTDPGFGRRQQVMIVLVLLLLACTPWFVSVDVLCQGDTVQFTIRRLGEYAVPVRRIRVVDKAMERTVWEVYQGNPESMRAMDRLRLQAGNNAVLPDGLARLGFQVSVPACGDSFELRPQRPYQIEFLVEGATMRKAFRIPGVPKAGERME
ncbi:MAG: hypothetical protein Kow0062_25240 [Acidobacteriota bacterium]